MKRRKIFGKLLATASFFFMMYVGVDMINSVGIGYLWLGLYTLGFCGVIFHVKDALRLLKINRTQKKKLLTNPSGANSLANESDLKSRRT
jgi:hypothetical protein